MHALAQVVTALVRLAVVLRCVSFPGRRDRRCCAVPLFGPLSQMGMSYVEAGRNLRPNIRERFMTFVRSREQMQSSEGGSGGAMDIVSCAQRLPSSVPSRLTATVASLCLASA